MPSQCLGTACTGHTTQKIRSVQNAIHVGDHAKLLLAFLPFKTFYHKHLSVGVYEGGVSSCFLSFSVIETWTSTIELMRAPSSTAFEHSFTFRQAGMLFCWPMTAKPHTYRMAHFDRARPQMRALTELGFYMASEAHGSQTVPPITDKEKASVKHIAHFQNRTKIEVKCEKGKSEYQIRAKQSVWSKGQTLIPALQWAGGDLLIQQPGRHWM